MVAVKNARMPPYGTLSVDALSSGTSLLPSRPVLDLAYLDQTTNSSMWLLARWTNDLCWGFWGIRAVTFRSGSLIAEKEKEKPWHLGHLSCPALPSRYSILSASWQGSKMRKHELYWEERSLPCLHVVVIIPGWARESSVYDAPC